jgi:hypothetical protein
MTRLKIVVGLVAMLCALIASTTPALAEFKDEKGGEEVKLKGGKVTFTAGAVKVKCAKVKGEKGFVAAHEGTTGAAAEDAPASEPVKEGEHLAIKLTFEECKEGEKTVAKVNAEKCQFEIMLNEQGETTSTTVLSLRSAKAKEACNLVVESESKCVFHLAAGKAKENEILKELKIKNLKAFQSEVEAKSVVTGVDVTEVAAACKLTEAETKEVKEGKKTELNFEEKVAIEGAELKGPVISRSKIDLDFGLVGAGGLTLAITFTNTGAVDWLPTTFTLRTLKNVLSVWKVTDKCSGKTVKPTQSCEVEFNFKPALNEKYEALFKLQGAGFDTMKGEG